MSFGLLRKLCFSSLACIAIGSGCASAPTVKAKGRAKSTGLEAFFPLASGNLWAYQGTMLGQPVARTVKLVGRDGEWFVDSEGEHYLFDGEGLRGKARYLLKGPLVAGTRWSSVVTLSSTERYRIDAVGVTSVTPAGRFEGCAIVLSENRQDAKTMLFKRDVYCPGVGLVGFDVWAEVEGKGKVPAASLELVRYEVGASRGP